jgi:hypothetical protein
VLKVVSNKHNDYISIKIEVACTAATVLRIRLLLLLKPLLLGYLIIRDVVVHLLLMLHETIHRSANRAATNLLR